MKRNEGPPPVVALIKGGLGNQLFCYAAGRALAHRLGRPFALDVTTGFRRDGYGRRFRLDRFPIAASFATPGECWGGDTRAWRHKLARGLARWRRLERRTYWTEAAVPADVFTSIRPPEKQIYLNGYWQNEVYFQGIAELLRRELRPPAPVAGEAASALGRISTAASPVFVHIRRERYQPRLAEDYYAEAIRRCLEFVPDASFFVFGDDAVWARKHLDFQGASAEFLDDRVPDEIDTLHLMAACRHAITANSSFSWWGAWLGEREGGHVWTPETPGFPVVAPARWHRVANRLES
jgi:hypothetical protein